VKSSSKKKTIVPKFGCAKDKVHLSEDLAANSYGFILKKNIQDFYRGKLSL